MYSNNVVSDIEVYTDIHLDIDIDIIRCVKCYLMAVQLHEGQLNTFNLRVCLSVIPYSDTFFCRLNFIKINSKNKRGS